MSRTRIARFFASTSLFVALAAVPANADEPVYDDAGRLIESTDSDGVTSHFIYDRFGELLETRRSDGTVVVHEPRAAPEDTEAEPDATGDE